MSAAHSHLITFGTCDVHGALGQDHSRDHALVLDTLRLLRAFEEGHAHDESITSTLDPAEVVGQVAVPANLVAVLPSTEQRVSRLQLQIGLPKVGAESRCRDVADLIDKVWVCRSHRQWEAELLERRRCWIVVRRLLVRHTAEVVLERRSAVVQPVSLLERDVAAPVGDFDVTLQQRGVGQRLVELVAHADLLHSARLELVVRTIRVRRTLLLRILLAISIEVRRQGDSLRDVRGGELELRLLLTRCVRTGRVRREAVFHILLVVLGNLCG